MDTLLGSVPQNKMTIPVVTPASAGMTEEEEHGPTNGNEFCGTL